jgi:hypothetical protein
MRRSKNVRSGTLVIVALVIISSVSIALIRSRDYSAGDGKEHAPFAEADMSAGSQK